MVAVGGSGFLFLSVGVVLFFGLWFCFLLRVESESGWGLMFWSVVFSVCSEGFSRLVSGGPKIAVPTLTRFAPHSIAAS